MTSNPTEITDELERLSRALERIHACWRRELGVSAYELLALLHLQDGELTIGELGTRLALSSGAMTGLVDRLEDTGFVERTRSRRDRRRVHVTITASTRDRLASLRVELTAQVAESVDASAAAALGALADRCTTVAEELE